MYSGSFEREASTGSTFSSVSFTSNVNSRRVTLLWCELIVDNSHYYTTCPTHLLYLAKQIIATSLSSLKSCPYYPHAFRAGWYVRCWIPPIMISSTLIYLNTMFVGYERCWNSAGISDPDLNIRVSSWLLTMISNYLG